jgi:hypothetical protein
MRSTNHQQESVHTLKLIRSLSRKRVCAHDNHTERAFSSWRALRGEPDETQARRVD